MQCDDCNQIKYDKENYNITYYEIVSFIIRDKIFECVGMIYLACLPVVCIIYITVHNTYV